jgi:transcriptional regulator with PAS, ATPase and Fis domain
VAGPARAEALAEKVERWLGEYVPPDYAWPGNVRQLEVCVRGVMMRSRCRRPPATARADAPEELLRDLREGKLSLRDAQRVYTTLVYAETNNLAETARRLEIERHSVPAKIDRALYERLREPLESPRRRGPSRSEPPPAR